MHDRRSCVTYIEIGDQQRWDGPLDFKHPLDAAIGRGPVKLVSRQSQEDQHQRRDAWRGSAGLVTSSAGVTVGAFVMR
jgi:hypothetical protein